MKNKFLSIIAVAAIALMLPGCAFHSGLMNNSAALSNANFSYVSQNVSGTASATYIFGFGGMSRQALVAEAKKDMLRTPLKSNQAIANTTINFKHTIIMGVYMQYTCTVTADVVEFK